MNQNQQIQNQAIPVFKTLRQTADMGFISLYSLRLMLGRGELPGYYAGSRYYVNVTKLLEMVSG